MHMHSHSEITLDENSRGHSTMQNLGASDDVKVTTRTRVFTHADVNYRPVDQAHIRRKDSLLL